MNINQSSQRAVINWNSFDVGSKATVNFNQPNAQAATLNYVNSASKSMINGAVNANGKVIFVNNNGVVFGKGAEVNVGGMVATTMNTSAQEFMDGKAIQTYEGGTTGKVINKGNITGNNINSYIALMAPQVVNTGVISATMGGNNAIALVAGQKVTLKFSGSQFVSVSVDASVVNALISNKLLINAGNGQVIIGANAAQNLMGSLIKNTGTVSANGINTSGGKISLTADNIEQSGTVEANSINANGGQVSLAANNINLASGSKTTATGATGGGNINVGVNVQNVAANSTSSTQAAVLNNQLANTVSIQANAIIDASATQKGNGGNISIWSQIKTLVAGSLFAKGGAQGGNGGFIETSSKGSVVLAATTQVDTSAPKGKTGTWTIDPVALIIDSTSASVISNALNTTSITLDATGNSCAFGACTQSQAPLIQILADIYSGNTNTALNLIATGGQIDINANVTAGQVYAVAQAINVNGSINTNGGSNSNIYLAGAIINILGNINSNGSNTGSNQNNSNSSNLNSANTTTSNNRRNGQNGLTADNNTYTSNGGLINILATGDITVGSTLNTTSYISANGINGGAINIVSTAGKTTINGIVDSIGKGLNSAGNGGNIAIVGKTQTDIIAALISSEGLSQGGVINLGQVNNLGNGTILAPPATAPPALGNFVNSAVAAAVGSNNSNNSITSSTINLDSQTGINAPNGSIVVFGDQISVNNSNLSAVNGTIAIGRESYSSGALSGLTAISNSTLIADHVETSGSLLGTNNNQVLANEWLLDPTNVTIAASTSTNASGTTTPAGTLATALAYAGVSNINTADIKASVDLGGTVNVVYTGTMTQTGALTFTPTTGTTGTLILDNRTGTAGTTSNVTLSGGMTNSGAGTVNLNVYSNGLINLAGALVSNSGVFNVAMQSTWQATNSTLGATTNINIGANITTHGGYVVLDGTGGTINGLGTSTPTITRGTDTATSGKGGKVNIGAYAITTTTTGAVASASTTGGNLVVASSGDVNFNGGAKADIGGSITISAEAGNSTNTSGGYGFFTTAGAGYLNSTGSINIDARTPWLNNTTVWISAPITSFSGGITIQESAAATVGGYGAFYINAAVNAYGAINLTASNANNPQLQPSINSTALGTITSTTGLVQITATGQATGVYTATLAGLISAPRVSITTTNSTAGSMGLSMVGATSGVTITADPTSAISYPTAGNALTVTTTVGTAGQTGGITITGGNILNQSNGGSVSFVTNGDLTETSAVNFSKANTSGGAQTITYDTRTGNATSQITTGVFTYNAAGATQKVNYVDESNGSPLTVGVTTISGYINIDNTCPSCTTPLTPASTAANITTSVGITVNGALSSGDYIYLNGLNNSATSNSIALGTNTLTTTSGSTAAIPITVIGNHNTANIGNPGIASTGAIAMQSSGGSILFKSNGGIAQSGSVTVAANVSGSASSITYDTTTGNKNSSITSGALTLTGGASASSAAINYIEKASGALIATTGALSMPGYILLDNTYGGTAGVGGTPVSGYINQGNMGTLATTTTNGVVVNGALTSGAYAGTQAITLNGISADTSATYMGVNVASATATIAATTGDINITGVSNSSYAVSLKSGITATAGNINIIGVETNASPTYTGSGVSYSAIANMQASGNINISGSELSASNGSSGVSINGNSAITSIIAGGNLSINGYNAATDNLYSSKGIYFGASGTLYLKSGGNTTISATDTSLNGSAQALQAYTFAAYAGGNFTIQGSTLGTSTNSSGDSIVKVATAAPGTAAIGPTGVSLISAPSTPITDGSLTIKGIYSVGNVNISGTGTAAGVPTPANGYNNSGVSITTTTGNVSITGKTAVAGLIGLNNQSAVINSAGLVSLTGVSTTASSITQSSAITAVTGVTITGSSTSGTSSGLYGAVSNTALITNTGANGVTVSSTGNTGVGAITNSGTDGISITGGQGIAAGTITGGTITAVGVLTNTGGGVISLSMAQPTSSTGGPIETAAGVTTANASISSNVSYKNVGGVMGAPNAATVNSVNYRALTQGISVTLKASYTQPYGTAYNSVLANNWLENPANATVTVTGATNFGAPTVTAAQAQASLIFAGTIGLNANSNLVQTATNLDGTTNILSNLGNVVTTVGSGNTYNITPKALTITGTQLSSTYNGVSTYENVANAGYTISGLVTNFNAGTVALPVTGLATGDTVSSVTHVIKTGATVLSNTAIAQACATTNCYTDAVSAALGTGLSNYTIAYVSGTFNVSKAALTITQGNSTATYSGSAQTFTPSYSVSGILGADSVSSLSTNTQTGTNAGSYTGTISGATGTGLANYTIAYNPGTLTINGIPVYVTAANDTKVYGASITGGAITYNSSGISTNPASSAYSVTGLLAGNSISGLTLTSVGGVANAGVGSSPYSIVPSAATISGAGAGNYTVYYNNGTMTITPKSITITANAVTTPIYGTSSALSQTAYTVVGGLVTGDAITAAAIKYGTGTSVPGTTNAATYAGALVPSGATGTGGFNSTNYTISYAAGSLTVNPLNLTITASAQSGATYGTAYSLGSSAYTQSIGTLPNSDVISSVTLQSSGANLVPGTTNAGSYTITPSAATFSSGIAANYNITYATGALTIGKANLTITPNAVSTTYNGTTLNNTTYSDAIANYAVSGYVGSDTSATAPISLTGSMAFNTLTTTAVKNAATYTYAVGTLAGASTNTNYNVVWANAPNNTYLINKALATVVATKLYDGTATFAASTLTVTGVGSETLTVSAGTGLANNVNVVGVSSLVTSGYTLGNGTGLAANYVLPATTSSVSITPLTLTASIGGTAQTKVYDTTSTANLSAGSCTVSPCTAGNGVTLSGITASSGSYTISGFVAGEGAYITVATGNYINAASGLATPNVTLNSAAVTAVSQANAVKVVIAPSNILALSNTTLSNYVLPGTAQSPSTATITAAPLSVVANNYSMFTGGTAPTAVSGVSVTSASPSAPASPGSTSLSAQVTGLLGSDSVAVSLPLPANFTTATGGTYTLTPTIASSVPSGNYAITPTTAILSVVGNQDLVISAGNATHVYGTVSATNLATSATPVVQYCAATSGACAGSVVSLTVSSTSTPNIWSATSTTGAIYNFTVSVATPSSYSTGGFVKVGSYTATASNNQVIHQDTSSILNTYYVTGTVAITPLVVTPVNNQTPSKVYDATTALTMTPLTTAGMALTGDILSLSGTAAYNSKNAGTNVGYTINNLALGSADAANYVLSTNTLAGTNGTITPAPLTVAGLSANNKVYDTTNTATISAAGQALVGVLGTDAVTISSTGNYSGTFSQVNVANGLTVTPSASIVGGVTVMTGVTLAGTDSGNYYVAGPSTALAANITPVAVSLTGTRVYNGTTAFSASNLTVAGIAGQTLVLGGSGTANSANVGIANTLSSTSG